MSMFTRSNGTSKHTMVMLRVREGRKKEEGRRGKESAVEEEKMYRSSRQEMGTRTTGVERIHW